LQNEGGLTAVLWGQPVAAGPSQLVNRALPPSGDDVVEVMRHRLESLLVTTEIPGLRFLPVGPKFQQDSNDFLPTEDMECILEALRRSAEVVILDGPPVLSVSETAALAAMGLGVLPVIDAGATRVDEAQMMHEELVRASARVLGVVLNRSNTTRMPYYRSGGRQTRRSRSGDSLRVLRS
jgi:Mrp family chromosome partitioning ATPase